MWRNLSKSLCLLGFGVTLCCGLYPMTVWIVGQALFPFQANGSVLHDQRGVPIGSRLVAQPFTSDEYFWPRPSAASYNASASAASTLAPSNYALRDRVARTLGPMVRYRSGAKPGQLVGPDVESWFRAQPHLVADWASAHPALAAAWVNADPGHGQFVESWVSAHPALLAEWNRGHPGERHPKPADLALPFFASYAAEHPGSFPNAAPAEIQATFFDAWRQAHPDADLQDVPGDFVTTSGSGLDPDITLENADYQLERVAAKWAADTGLGIDEVRRAIADIIQRRSFEPFDGLAGGPLVNVLEVNLELRTRYGAVVR